MPSLTVRVWDFQNNALWDSFQHATANNYTDTLYYKHSKQAVHVLKFGMGRNKSEINNHF